MTWQNSPSLPTQTPGHKGTEPLEEWCRHHLQNSGRRQRREGPGQVTQRPAVREGCRLQCETTGLTIQDMEIFTWMMAALVLICSLNCAICSPLLWYQMVRIPFVPVCFGTKWLTFSCPCLLWYQMVKISFVTVCFGTKWFKFHLSPFALVLND